MDLVVRAPLAATGATTCAFCFGPFVMEPLLQALMDEDAQKLFRTTQELMSPFADLIIPLAAWLLIVLFCAGSAAHEIHSI